MNGISRRDADGQDVRLDQIWTDFCSQLSQAGKALLDPDVPGTELDQAEGLRYFTRLTRAAIELYVESSDPDFPRLFPLSDETIKIGADNPDNIYATAIIAGDREYRITGHRGTVPLISFGTKTGFKFGKSGPDRMTKGMMQPSRSIGVRSTGELELGDLHIEPDGSFEIMVSQTRKGRNWLPMAAETEFLLIRQTFDDKATQTPATLKLERIGGPAHPVPLTRARIEANLKNALTWVQGSVATYPNWTELYMTRPNEIISWDQSVWQKQSGAEGSYYLHGYWKLAPDEAWVIELEPTKCKTWNFVIQNWWMESLDYVNSPHNVYLNKHKAKLEPDGRLVLVVADRDPGFGNWLYTAGHSSGTACSRWILSDAAPVARCRVIEI